MGLVNPGIFLTVDLFFIFRKGRRSMVRQPTQFESLWPPRIWWRWWWRCPRRRQRPQCAAHPGGGLQPLLQERLRVPLLAVQLRVQHAPDGGGGRSCTPARPPRLAAWPGHHLRSRRAGFAAGPTADMIGAYAQSVPRRDGVNGVTAAEVGVQPDFSCSADRVAQFSHGLDCSVMAGTAVGPPPSSFAAAKGGLAGGSEGSSSSGQGVRRFSAPTSSPIGFRIRWKIYFYKII